MKKLCQNIKRCRDPATHDDEDDFKGEMQQSGCGKDVPKYKKQLTTLRVEFIEKPEGRDDRKFELPAAEALVIL